MLTYWLLNAHHSWSYLAPNHIPSQAYPATKINFFILSLHPSLPLYMLFVFILPLLENSYDSLKPNLMSLMISFSVKPSLASLIRVGSIFPTLLFNLWCRFYHNIYLIKFVLLFAICFSQNMCSWRKEIVNIHLHVITS